MAIKPNKLCLAVVLLVKVDDVFFESTLTLRRNTAEKSVCFVIVICELDISDAFFADDPQDIDLFQTI